MPSYRVLIPETAAEKLTDLARRDFRAPRQQAAAMLVDAIERAGRPQADAPTRESAASTSGANAAHDKPGDGPS